MIVMKVLTVRLPEPLAAEIESESRRRKLSKSDVVRERLEAAGRGVDVNRRCSTRSRTSSARLTGYRAA